MRKAVVYVVLCTALLAVAAQKSTPRSDREEWVALTGPREACDEHQDCEEHPRTVAVRSPDGSKNFAVRPGRDGKPIITITVNGKPVRHDVQYMSQARLQWSPVSNAFLIESTSAGSYDGWALQVFVFNGNQVEEFDVGMEARKDLARAFPPCVPGDELNTPTIPCDSDSWGDEFNVFALKWLSGDRLLIAAQIPCSTSYGPNWCKMKAYEVSVPSGRILAAYTHAEAHERYPTLVTAEKSHIISLTGWVKTEGAKTVFINDQDEHSWNVSNPDALVGHDGHHVRVKAHIIEADNSVEITAVKMLQPGGDK